MPYDDNEGSMVSGVSTVSTSSRRSDRWRAKERELLRELALQGESLRESEAQLQREEDEEGMAGGPLVNAGKMPSKDASQLLESGSIRKTADDRFYDSSMSTRKPRRSTRDVPTERAERMDRTERTRRRSLRSEKDEEIRILRERVEELEDENRKLRDSHCSCVVQ
eukprot:Sspe_Gene.115380::Locus_102625_Transcript_1_2_Confidence_0.500_Length_1314::g.115380::m.115380